MSPALERAQEVRNSLNPKFPSFVKSMLRSHVTLGFWLGLPIKFCNLYLPKEDVTITLIDENKEEYATKYISGKQGLSGGWRGFSIAHGLVEGDALIFHLVKATEFQVIIIKAYNSDDLKPVIQFTKIGSRNDNKTGKKIEQNRSKTPTLAALRQPVENLKNRSGEENASDVLEEGKHIKTCKKIERKRLKTLKENLKNGSGKVDASEVLEGIRFSQSAIKFEDVKGLDDFRVVVNGLNINSELSQYTRSKYYELCHSQNALLHDKLMEGMNYKLVAGIISETVNIADAIRASKLSSSKNEFDSWDKCLGAFEQMGMNVTFLRAQLQQPEVRAVIESEEMVNSKICCEDTDELANVEEDIRNLRNKIMEFKRPSKKLRFKD